jgi:hypothetical protein
MRLHWLRRGLILLAVCAVTGMAQEDGRPACTAKTRGTLWPERANTDSGFAKRARNCGELYVCARGAWRHQWRAVAVHISHLAKGPKPAIPGCGSIEASGTQSAALGLSGKLGLGGAAERDGPAAEPRF